MSDATPQMPVAPAPVAPQPQKAGAVLVLGLIFGILSIFFVILPYAGIPLGIAAITLAAIGHYRNKLAGLWLGGLITGIIGMVLNLTAVGLMLLFSGIGATAGDRPYSDAVKELQSAQTTFTQDETITFGSLDIKVLDVKRTPVITSYAAPREDVSVTLELSRSKTPIGKGVSAADWTNGIRTMTLNGKGSSKVETGGKSLGFDTIDKDGSQQVTLLYRIPQADALALEYTSYYFTRVSWLVGTEGMPTEDANYTIHLRP